MRHELPHAPGSDNEVVMPFAPPSFAGPGVAFSALPRVSDLDRRLAVLSPGDHVCHFGDEFVMAFVHEILHTYGMAHNPLEADGIDFVEECCATTARAAMSIRRSRGSGWMPRASMAGTDRRRRATRKVRTCLCR